MSGQVGRIVLLVAEIPATEGLKMTHITLTGISQILKQDDVKFVRQGRSGKSVHILIGTGYQLACGGFERCTENRRPSAIFKLIDTEMDNSLICKRCLKALQIAVEPVLVGA